MRNHVDKIYLMSSDRYWLQVIYDKLFFQLDYFPIGLKDEIFFSNEGRKMCEDRIAKFYEMLKDYEIHVHNAKELKLFNECLALLKKM